MKLKPISPLLGNSIDYPKKGTALSAGFDVRACIEEPIQLKRGETQLIPLGFALQAAQGCAVVLLPRSGLGHKNGIVLGNLVGLIDEDYQGEVFASVWNRSDEDFIIEPGERIAQMVQLAIANTGLEVVADFDEATERGAGGFGHTGTK